MYLVLLYKTTLLFVLRIMAIRCCLHHQQHLPARAMRSIIFPIHILRTYTTHFFHRYVLILNMLYFAHMSHHKCFFVLIRSQRRSFSIVSFGLKILSPLCHECCFVHPYYLESLWFVVRRYDYIRRRVRRWLPSRTIIVISLSVHVFHDKHLASSVLSCPPAVLLALIV